MAAAKKKTAKKAKPRKRAAPQTWEKIGVIGVDAGLCWVGDPCYILHNELPADIGKNWDEFCDKIFDRAAESTNRNSAQFHYDLGHPGLGVAVSTGYGDGEYDVLIRRSKDNRVAEVKVVFIEE